MKADVIILLHGITEQWRHNDVLSFRLSSLLWVSSILHSSEQGMGSDGVERVIIYFFLFLLSYLVGMDLTYTPNPSIHLFSYTSLRFLSACYRLSVHCVTSG
ncbi:uncharacterized protein EI97DRAFT_71643 [Westerdykella ornata]|uniref:Uncharacterized protein n=1 Tax=Westerdykella ornata TaxID=318751 RepID=A0A6A6JGS5_WESOR|nr:uncharacterized protein EI97DRAFT_71643 [Westerdykella ornata]KAF2275761.1 hypothetical protein EI97DRAFT_71643 [Westerdykella ornata]